MPHLAVAARHLLVTMLFLAPAVAPLNAQSYSADPLSRSMAGGGLAMQSGPNGAALNPAILATRDTTKRLQFHAAMGNTASLVPGLLSWLSTAEIPADSAGHAASTSNGGLGASFEVMRGRFAASFFVAHGGTLDIHPRDSVSRSNGVPSTLALQVGVGTPLEWLHERLQLSARQMMDGGLTGRLVRQSFDVDQSVGGKRTTLSTAGSGVAVDLGVRYDDITWAVAVAVRDACSSFSFPAGGDAESLHFADAGLNAKFGATEKLAKLYGLRDAPTLAIGTLYRSSARLRFTGDMMLRNGRFASGDRGLSLVAGTEADVLPLTTLRAGIGMLPHGGMSIGFGGSQQVRQVEVQAAVHIRSGGRLPGVGIVFGAHWLGPQAD